MDAIQEAMQKATEAAAAQVAAGPGAASTSTDVAVAAQQGGAVGMPAAPATPMTMESLMSGSINVDIWLKVKEFGLLVGDKSDLVSEIKAIIDMTEGTGFVVKKSIKAGNPVQYWSTYDGVGCDKGGSWTDAIAKARQIDPKAGEYRSVDVPMVLTEDVKNAKGDVVLAEAGKTAGYSTSTTNWREWETFYKSVVMAGLLGKRVEVVVGFKPMSNKNNNKWGVMTWTLVGEVGQGGE
ncbi:hypothetical protein [Cupriavidus sp. DL-D2]|uniref:hypothetical protein n=1 Tax=Cupriavidus sp. DL-D2 TaxID=3144974 RepID=UPI0032152D27